jgi:hypothetical protein
MDTVIIGSDYMGICLHSDEKLPERLEAMNMDIAAVMPRVNKHAAEGMSLTRRG